MPRIHQDVSRQLHAVVALLDVLKPQQQALEFGFTLDVPRSRDLSSWATLVASAPKNLKSSPEQARYAGADPNPAVSYLFLLPSFGHSYA